MQTERERAVIACLDERNARRFAGVLFEAGYDVADCAYSAQEVLPKLREHRPRLLLAETILPGGDGVSLVREIMLGALEVYPHVLLIPVGGFCPPGCGSLEGLGAAMLKGFPTSEAIHDAVRALEAGATRLPPERDQRLQSLMDRLGVPAHAGRDMLYAAVALAWRNRDRLKNLRDRIYPDAARPFGKTGSQAERAIRHVIEAAWRTGEIDEQQRIFGDTIDARRGRPTCGEMIAQLADILRWEG